jgi:dihydrolipoamide dehydrogenase
MAPYRKVDVAIIGAGTAGMTAWRAARRHTPSVLLIEGRHYGTMCARVGCMPSKLLIAAAEKAHALTEAARFGVTLGDVRIDGRKVMDRVRRERDRFVGSVVRTVEDWPADTRLMGQARFLGPHTLEVDGTIVEAGRIVIATGSAPVVPAAWAAASPRVIVNDDVFDWEDLPGSVAVIGAGVIGLELGQALHRLGVRVRIFGRSDRLAGLSDPEVLATAQDVLSAELDLSPDTEIVAVLPEGDGLRIRSRKEGVLRDDLTDYALVAIGRRPALAALVLEKAGIPLGPDGIPPFDPATGRIGQSHIFIAGDATHARPLLHEAADLGRIAGDNAGRYPQVIARPRRSPLSIVFSDPQIAVAGASYQELAACGEPFATGAVSFADQGRARVMGVNRGHLRVYGDPATGRFLGAEMVGPSAEHIGHLLAWAHQAGRTVQQMLDSPFYHPVIEEGLRTALRDLSRAMRRPAPTPETCLDCDTPVS